MQLCMLSLRSAQGNFTVYRLMLAIVSPNNSPPNHKAISFCAFSTLSLPWMTLRPTSMQ
jgi:hypothetical protein